MKIEPEDSKPRTLKELIVVLALLGATGVVAILERRFFFPMVVEIK